MIDLSEFAKLLSHFDPPWVLRIVVASILAYRSPQLVKEPFAGLERLFSNRQTKKPRT
jgi:hypothetical protein